MRGHLAQGQLTSVVLMADMCSEASTGLLNMHSVFLASNL